MNRIARAALIMSVVAVLASLLSACGSDSESSTADGDGAFPVSIKHAQGTTTIPKKPKRVVAMGSADVQIAHALGANLVGAAKNDYSPDGQWLGVEPALGDDVELLPYVEPDLEKLAELKPDLILITSAQPGFSEQYKTLSKIAPTLSYRKGLLEDNGDELLTMISQALGAEDKADALRAEASKAMTDWVAKHPELKGKKFAFGQYVTGTTYIVVSPTAPSIVFYRELGLPLSDELSELPVQAPPGITTISDEKLDLLDTVDYVVLGVGSEADGQKFLDLPVVKGLDVAKAGHIRFVDFNVATGVLAPSPATTPAILAELDKILEAE